MAIVIGEVRLSFIWTQMLPALLSASPPEGTPLPVLSQKGRYSELFDDARAVEAESVTLGEPWPEPDGGPPYSCPWPVRGGRVRQPVWFWHNYLDKPEYENVAADRAWRLLVPLRVARALRLAADGLHGRGHLEAFCYPQGIALMATFSLLEPGGLDQTMESARRARSVLRYEPSPPEGGPGEPVALARLAAWARERLEQVLVGGGDPEAGGFREPFSVATVIRGSGEPNELEPTPDGPVHRALEGLCTFSSSWASDPLHALTVWQPEIKGGPGAGALHRSRRGRAVWVPAKIAAQEKVFSMGRYHRNLALATMQVESLLGLIDWAADRLRHGDLTVDAEDLARNAGFALARLNGKAGQRMEGIYRTCSVPAQISDSGLVDAVNFIRKRLGGADRQPLHVWYG